MKTSKWIGLMSGAGLIALSASGLAGTPAMAADPVMRTDQQTTSDQQLPQWKQQKKLNSGQTSQQQPNQPPKNQQNGQQWNQQNGQAQSRQYGQQWNQQNGQPQYTQSHRYDWATYQPGHSPPQWQQYGQRFDAQSYQWNRTSYQRYHYRPYVQPYGWYAQRWEYGQILPALFWGRDYWLTDYAGFGLIDPPYGYVWVRYGNDALLVDVESGQILSVEYGVFYT